MSDYNFSTLQHRLETQGVDPETLDELVHEAASEQASAVNNEGLKAQLEYLFDAWGDRAEQAIQERRGTTQVPAVVHSDDRLHEVAFDAAPYLMQCRDDEIEALIECVWGGDYVADDVAEFFKTTNMAIKALFSHIELLAQRPSTSHLAGFECHLNKEAAEAWVRAYRPHLAD